MIINQIYIWTFLIVLVVQICFYPVIFGKLYKSYKTKNYDKAKKEIKKAIALVVFSGLFFEMLPGSNIFWWPTNTIYDLTYTKSRFGKYIYLGKPLYEHKELEPWFGDGITYNVYKLNSKNSNYFSNPTQNFYKTYPKENYGDNWQISSWKHTPIQKIDKEELEEVVSSINNSPLDLNEIINERNNLYSFIYDLDQIDYKNHIDIHIVCPQRKLIIIITYDS